MPIIVFLKSYPGIAYLFEDRFTTDDAAPITSPRSAESTGTLTLVQSAGAQSISSAKLNFTSPAGWGTQGWTAGSFARTSGRRYLVDFTVTSSGASARCFFAWMGSAAVSYANIAGFGLIAIYSSGSNFDLYIINSAAATPFAPVTGLVLGTTYQLMLVHRAAGYFFYLKGGAYTDWTLILATSGTTTTPIYPGWGNNSQTGTMDNLLVPETLWMPTAVVGDGFANRGNATYVSRYASNPVIAVTVDEPVDQYVPAPIRLGSGDIWVYVKGASDIYAYKSTDNGETFVIQNGGSPVIDLGGGMLALEPCAVYEASTNTIHLWFKRGSGTHWSIYYATAADSAPQTVTVVGEVLAEAAFNTALSVTTEDLTLGDVIKIGSTWYCYGAYFDGTNYNIWYGTAGSFGGTITAVGNVLLGSAGTGGFALKPTVFRWGGTGNYRMIFGTGAVQPGRRSLITAVSADGISWTRENFSVLRPDEGVSGFEDQECYAPAILKTSTAPFDAPAEISGKYLLYYSGLTSTPSLKAQTGLAYLQDNGANTVEANFPVTTAGSTDGDQSAEFLGGGGLAWTLQVGGWDISGNQLKPNDAAGTPARWLATVDAGIADAVIVADVKCVGSNDAGIVLRLSDSSNLWLVAINASSGAAYIIEVNAGTPTTRATAAASISASSTYTITVLARGTTIEATVNGVNLYYGSASLNSAETKHGLYAPNINPVFNNFAIANSTQTSVPS